MKKTKKLLGAIPLSILLALAGCDAIGAALYQVNGPPAVKAKYVPQKQPMLVLVESYGNTGIIDADSLRLSRSIMDDLKDNDVAPLIDSAKLDKFRDSDLDAFGKMTIADVGRKLGARQVLYVNIAQAEVDTPTGSQATHGIESATVKIVDTNSAQTLWPTDYPSGQSFSIETPWFDNTAAKSSDDMRTKMANQMGTKIGELFHDWKPKTPQSEDAGANGY